jgi:hypothetical protein
MTHYKFDVFKSISTSIVYPLGAEYDVPKYKWLKWLLGKLGWLEQSQYTHRFDTVSRVTISESSILDTLRRGGYELRKMRFHPPTRIYIGHEHFDTLMQEVNAKNTLFTPITYPIKLYGIEIVATPYLEGILPVWD